ncbi:MAG: prolipoprotein diacylglyceryl transferase [Candidatus Omnitrophica bacterium]|nr:prolipoprotein diacylglyceryl transferase [Candidatus Omnitrophota bacterium]
MYPYICEIGPWRVPSYGVAMAAAFLIGVWWAARLVRRLPAGPGVPSADETVDCLSWGMFGGVLGGRVLYILLNWEVYRAAPWEWVAVWHGGLVWYGGFIGGVLSLWLCLRRHRRSLLAMLDRIAPVIALGHAIGRLGCFANGCCYGKPTAAWWGVQFPGLPAPVIPTQLLESAGLVLLAVVLRRRQTPTALRRRGTVFGWYLIGYGALRWLLECWRGDQPLWWAGLTLSQWISVGLLVAGATLLARVKSAK